jgi:antitoxin ParD1/3/4
MWRVERSVWSKYDARRIEEVAVSMTIALPPELERFVSEQVASGAYPTPVDVIRVGLELLREQEMIDQFPKDELRRELMIGIAEADRGELSPFDPKAALDELRSGKSGV